MNERLPDSSGLPLRAMVMVLLFLGIIFLLVGFQALGSSEDASSDETVTPVTSSATPTTSETPQATARPGVLVLNTSGADGAGAETADRLRAANWDVTDTRDFDFPELNVTTVYHTEAPGELAAANEIGQLLGAPVELRAEALAQEPPGVIVAIAR